MLPLLRGLESDKTYGNTALHGDDGPMPVTRDHTPSPLARAALAAGIVADPDKNADTTVGVGPVPTNVTDGHRVDVFTAYLGPGSLGTGSLGTGSLDAGAPAGLDVRSGVTATRIRIINGRTVGVETTTGFVPAGQVVLCAGTIATAHLLLLSGIGPHGQLTGLGVRVVADLPVGVGLSDHPQVVLPGPTGTEGAGPVRNWLGAVVHLTSPGSAVAGNVEILESRLPIEALMAGAAAPTRSTLLLSDLTPRRRGSLRLVSPDPTVDPVVELGYLGEASDRATLAFAIRAAQELAGTSALGPKPTRSGTADVGTSVHTCSSAPMGTVTDGFGRVLGVAGLRVGDASLLPMAPSRGPANTAVLIGELLGRLIDT